jgi:lysophospholipase L1-like esterase
MTRRRPTLALALLIGLAGCAHAPGHRYFQPSAAQMGPEPNSYGEAVIPRHGLVVVQGDDFAYGLARGRSRYRINDAAEGQSSITLSETLRRAVKGVKVENRGFPGDTAAASAERWAAAPRADLVVLCLGYGDAAAQTPLDDFKDTLRDLIADLHASGAAVFVVTPPTTTDLLAESVLGPYRDAAEGVGAATGAVVFKANDSMSRIHLRPTKGVAQLPAVYQAVAADIGPYVKVVDAPSPQAGQAGSADSRTVRVSAASAS